MWLFGLTCVVEGGTTLIRVDTRRCLIVVDLYCYSLLQSATECYTSMHADSKKRKGESKKVPEKRKVLEKDF